MVTFETNRYPMPAEAIGFSAPYTCTAIGCGSWRAVAAPSIRVCGDVIGSPACATSGASCWPP